MKNRTFLLGPALLSLFFCVCSCGRDSDASLHQGKQEGPQIPRVIVSTVQKSPIFKAYTAVGSVSPKEISRISSKVSGRIQTIPVDEGDQVKKGEMLMLIDPFDHERALKSADSQLKQAKTSLERARRDLLRMEGLYRAKAVTEQTYQDAATACDLARFQYDQAVTAREIAEENLKECRLAAPIAGIVTEVLVNEGELTGPQQPTFVIMDMSTVKVEVDLPEEIFGSVKIGNTSTITVDAVTGQAFEGTITKIYPTIDPVSRTFMVTITLENPALMLRSGMTARSRVIQMVRRDVLAVPRESLIRGEEGYIVYTVREDVVYRHPVSLGIEGDTLCEVTGGVSEGDKVVVKGVAGLKPGITVMIVEEGVLPEA